MPGPFYFAWCDEDTAWGAELERFDEPIVELELSQSEGAAAQLTIDIERPGMGLLAPGRQQWCWFAWFDGSAVQPLFHGRVMGAPANIVAEVWRLVFLARSTDYQTRKAALAATLRVLPYWDPVWLVQSIDDPDTVLEARTALWHIDPKTLDLTISDITEGEDGTIDVDESEHFYDGIDVSYGPEPKRRIHVKGTITYDQEGAGEVDMTAELVAAFSAAGSPFGFPMVSSFTADGLLGDWPQPGASFSGGWSVAADASAAVAGAAAPVAFAVRYIDKTDNTSLTGVAERDDLGNPLPGEIPRLFFINWKNYDVTFSCQPLLIDFRVVYEAARKRSEIVTFTVTAAAQSILTDPEGADEEIIELTSAFVDQPVDDGGALPIGDKRRNVYFPTDRGQLSIQFMMLLARSKIVVGSRAVNIKFESTWEKLAAAISCRKSILLYDRRLPGGQAAGKVIGYRLLASDRGDNHVEATIGCSIGYGIVLPAADAGEDTYATGYATGYTARSGAQVAVIDGALHYESLAGTYVVDDDGVDLFNMTPAAVIDALTVTDGPNDQRGVIEGALRNPGTRPQVDILTTGDISSDGLTVSNLQNVEGLVSGVAYRIDGQGIPRVYASSLSPGAVPDTTITFDGAAGGTLSAAHTGPFRTGAVLRISTLAGAELGITPDPVGALREHPTTVALDLVPVTGGDFQTLYAVNVLDLVIPKTIDLEAA